MTYVDPRSHDRIGYLQETMVRGYLDPNCAL